MTFPRNEAETIALYKLCQHRLGWRITHLQIAFPDAIIENEQGKQLVAEFEFESKNFQAHGHDPDGCDIIIAYKDSWENPPVPVWALGKYTQEEVAIINEIIKSLVPRKIVLGVYNTIRKAIKALGLKPGTDGLPTLSEEYWWGYELLTSPPKGWEWAIGMATPPEWRKSVLEAERNRAD